MESKRLPRTIEFLIEQGGRNSKNIETLWLYSLKNKGKYYIDYVLQESIHQIIFVLKFLLSPTTAVNFNLVEPEIRIFLS